MKKNIFISLLAILGLCGVTLAQEDYQGQLSDKKIQSMGILSSGSPLKGSLGKSKESSDYDQEYEDLLKSIHTSDNNNYELDSKLIDAGLTHYENYYDTLLNKASEILGEEKVYALTNQIEEADFEKNGKKANIEISGGLGASLVSDKAKKVKKVHLKDNNEIIEESFSLVKSDDTPDSKTKIKSSAEDSTNQLYQKLLDELNDGSGDEVIQLFNIASAEELEGEDFQDELLDDYPLQKITTVGLFKGEKKHFKKCLIMKTYGRGTWRTYCQPITKPTQCADQEWRDLSTMAIMYC